MDPRFAGEGNGYAQSHVGWSYKHATAEGGTPLGTCWGSAEKFYLKWSKKETGSDAIVHSYRLITSL